MKFLALLNSSKLRKKILIIFYHAAVLPSMECGLIPEKHLTVSGNGTAVHTHACPNGHHRNGAPDNLRHFPDPDAARGWNSDLLLRFTSAKQHDSVSFLVAFHELKKHMPAVSTTNICLDSAMNNYPTYRILKKEEYGYSST